ncbi:RNA-binding RNA processing protein rpp1 [Knufia peltigerae]|uniref:RNA-binding RNA processing protein rpp1 n=1 Tax=Knufia peltigerae TaxID=1002370 RepID=A0AA38Y3T2_9EURO|nr:RNA-binding RNA processing protein rpp1 [Knufia peltigerae]
MPFHDLNITYTPSQPTPEINQTLLFASELGYRTIALNLTLSGKLPPPPPPIPVSTLDVPPTLKILTRLTVTISDASQNHRLSAYSPAYDILALRPTNEKNLQLCCGSLECDLISLDFSQRLQFPLRFKTVSSALQRGLRFEVCYSPGVSSSGSSPDARRNLIGGATALIRATRGRGIVFSSEARSALGLRGPHDVINLASLWGLGQERGKEALCEEADKVVRLAGIKRSSFRVVVDVIDGGGGPVAVAEPTKSQPRRPPAPGQTQPQTEKGVVKGQDDRRGKQKATTDEVRMQKGTTATTDESIVSNGLKRKASTTTPQNQPGGDQQPASLSNREKKRRARKQARMES